MTIKVQDTRKKVAVCQQSQTSNVKGAEQSRVVKLERNCRSQLDVDVGVHVAIDIRRPPISFSTRLRSPLVSFRPQQLVSLSPIFVVAAPICISIFITLELGPQLVSSRLVLSLRVSSCSLYRRAAHLVPSERRPVTRWAAHPIASRLRSRRIK